MKNTNRFGNMFGGVRSSPGNTTERYNRRKKTKIQYKINKKPSKTVDQSAIIGSVAPLQRETLKKQNIKADETGHVPTSTKKRNTLGPAAVSGAPALFPKINLSCREMAQVKEENEEEGGDGEQNEEKSPILHMTEEQISGIQHAAHATHICHKQRF